MVEVETGLKERFLKIYADIPLKLRKEIILVLDKEPMTWNAAYIEIVNSTVKSEKILNILKDLRII